MIDRAGLATALETTRLGGRDVIEVRIPDCDEVAFAVACDASDAFADWQAARSLSAGTERWPVLAESYERVEAMLTHRMGYAEPTATRLEVFGEDLGDTSPIAVLRRAGTLTADEAVSSWRRSCRPIDQEGAADGLDWHLDVTAQLRGSSPDPAETMAAIGPDATVATLEHFLLRWEAERFGTASPLGKGAAPSDAWFEPAHPHLLFLPTAPCWESFAFLPYYAAWCGGHEEMIAIARRWSDRYGAELVANWGTMLQYEIAHRPSGLDEAWMLAGELLLLGQSIQVCRRHIAFDVLNNDRWFLHDRP